MGSEGAPPRERSDAEGLQSRHTPPRGRETTAGEAWRRYADFQAFEERVDIRIRLSRSSFSRRFEPFWSFEGV